MSNPEEPLDLPLIPEMDAIWGKGEKGDKGDRGEKGDKGDRGNKGPVGPESKLAQAAEAEVTRLVKAKAMPKWVGRLLIGVCAALVAVVVVLGAWVIPSIHNETVQNKAYTNTVVQHECAALELLTSKPVPYPADPAANPSRVTTYNFYVALKSWERSDGCDTLHPDPSAK